ncbi:haloacid dehalogenase type II [Arthrobacter sp. JZ12]|uniref:haloacid dehalogenase type II n=1 Tax=Arthrobacter sp. JZ12 TaxID=2654190 RepID=UPI002B48750A|nr:haloacid dehalogenase type II [Arthrobacter sp. JZ12]WRH24143.1 haloacid dehalogenase type II [Arthrobacter sp. JZ12]
MAHLPRTIVFDVNETLSNLGPLGGAFESAGLPELYARVWFGGILRDGFALTVTNDNPAFADLATDSLQRLCVEVLGNGNHEGAVEGIMQALMSLSVHDDVVPGVEALADLAELITLSNGASSVADALIERAGIRGRFSELLSVAEAVRWKPAGDAYEYAASKLGQRPGELLLVAVHPWDIHGASRAGLRTAWINRSGAAYPAYFEKPDHEVGTLIELAEVLA